MASVTRCDGCGKDETAPGLRLLAPLSVGPDMLAVALLAGRKHWDLCSWKCVADFASLKALDPTPQTSE